MMRNRLRNRFALGLLLSGIITACGEQQASPEIASPAPVLVSTTEERAVAYSAGQIIPGPRSCFWKYGPHSADPYINLAYPDASVFYWAATFSTPAGATLELDGDFAHARYQSLISYDERGRPIESLADYLIDRKRLRQIRIALTSTEMPRAALILCNC